MKKRLISLLLAGCMTAMLSVAAFAADTTGADAKDEEASLKPPVSVVFKDVPVDAWYTPSVQYVYNHDIMIGVSADRFAPEVGFNRAMIVQTMYNRSSDKTFNKNAAPAFTDVTNKNLWFYDAVQWAAQRGVIAGYGDGTFRPYQNVTRQEFAKILYYAAGSPSIVNGAVLPHPDFKDVGAWAKNAMIWCNARKIIQGVPVNGVLYLQPQGVANRAQAARMLSQYLGITG